MSARFVVRRRRSRTILAALAIALPRSLRRFLHCRLLGYEIDPGATVGRSFIDVERLRMESGASIGSLTVVRGCEDVEMGPDSTIGPLVLVNGVRSDSRYFSGETRHPAVIMGRGAMLSCLHVIDACDEITLGEFAEFAGFGSQILTHSIDYVRVKQTTRPVTIGHHCMIGTSTVLLPGASVPDCTIVAAGSVVPAGSTPESHHLYGGVPAQSRRAVSPKVRFFHHTDGDVL